MNQKMNHLSASINSIRKSTWRCVRDMTTGELRYVWQETSGLDHYRHAHAYDHLAGMGYGVPRISVIV